MKTAEALTVAVRSAGGGAVEGARVTRADAQQRTETVTTDAKGLARFTAPAAEPATITVTAADFAPDSRATGGDYPVRSDGLEEFVLGAPGLPSYFRGRVRVPFVPVLDAVGVQTAGGPETAGNVDAIRSLLNSDARLIRSGGAFEQSNVAIVQLPELGGGEGSDGVAREVSRDRIGALDEVIRRAAGTRDGRRRDGDARDDVAAAPVEELGAIVALDDRGAAFLTERVVVSLLDDSVDAAALAAEHGFDVVKQFTALPRTWVFRAPGESGYALLDRLAALAAAPGVRYAEPSLVQTVENDTVTPNDFLFPLQWDHPIIGTPEAWQFIRDVNATNTFGNPAITVAVVDNGVDAGHPSLAGNVSDGQPKISQIFDFANMVANHNTTNTGDQADHGMCCASAATGLTGNAEGTAGIAGNCHLIAIRRGGDEVRYSEAYLWAGGLDPGSSTTGFPAQLTDGADVISSSYGFSVDAPISALMSDTFDALTDNGRGGRGVAMFFSAGNDSVDLDTTNRRPWSMYGRCYGVAASTIADDGTTEIQAIYSNFGSTVDFCAPSNDNRAAGHNPPRAFGGLTATHRATPLGHALPRAAVTATTVSTAAAAGATTAELASVAGVAMGDAVLFGTPGGAATRGRLITNVNAATRTITVDRALTHAYAVGTPVAAAPWEYRSNFGGTSYATPVTAGVAALMYSVNPQLRWNQIGEILQRTAVKIDPNNTDPVGRWRDVDGRISTDPGYRGPFFSEYFGAGRIDARAAVLRAKWTVDLVTDTVEFNDVPEGETTYRAVRVDVRSLYASALSTTTAPSAPFGLPLGSGHAYSGTSNYQTVQEGYIWISYTGTNDGDTASSSITVRHNQTGLSFTVPITANTVAKQTACVMLVLDRSGSMDSASGIGTSKRIDVLDFSAGILVEAMHEGDGVGIVSFDHDAQPVLVPPVGPLERPGTLFAPIRDSVRGEIDNFAVNLNGATSIGDGIELGQSELNPVADYDNKSVIVFTDGYENQSKFLHEVAGSITDRSFAVALGRAEAIRPQALTQVTNSTGGYCVLTGDLGVNSRYKLAKYFLQVLAGVKNDEVVIDPPVAVAPGDTVEVPFLLTEADTSAEVIFMTQYPELVILELVAPDGDVADEAFIASLGGRNYVHRGKEVLYYRFALKLPIGSGAHDGEWRARFSLNMDALKGGEYPGEVHSKGYDGVLLVHGSSNLKLEAALKQDSLEPRAKVRVEARLTEYGVPVEHRAETSIELTAPNGSINIISMAEVAPGVFEEYFEAESQGVWTVRIMVTGKTFRGSPFTRETVRTASVWRGGDTYEPEEGEEPKPTHQ